MVLREALLEAVFELPAKIGNQERSKPTIEKAGLAYERFADQPLGVSLRHFLLALPRKAEILRITKPTCTVGTEAASEPTALVPWNARFRDYQS